MKKDKRTIEEKFFSDLGSKNKKKQQLAFTPILTRIRARVENATIFSVLDARELAPGQIDATEKLTEAEALYISEDSTDVISTKTGNRILPAEFIVSKRELLDLKDVAIRNYFRIHEIEESFVSSLEKELNSKLELLVKSAVKKTSNILRIKKRTCFLIAIFDKDILYKKLYTRISKLEGDNILLLSTKTLKNLIYSAYLCRDTIIQAQLAQNKLFNCALAVIEGIPNNEIYAIEKNIGKLYTRVFASFSADRFSAGKPQYGWIVLIQCSMLLTDISNILKIEIK
jgi:hypothetical protein